MAVPLSSLAAEVARDFARAARPLIAADLAFKLAGAALVAPVLGAALRAWIAFSGHQALADTDLVHALLRPSGLVVALLITTTLLALSALRLAAVVIIGHAAGSGRSIASGAAIAFVLGRAATIFRLCGRVLATSLLLAAPFLGAGAGVYGWLLTGHDINWYLSERPPALWLAAGILGALGAGLVALLLPRLVGWSLALPIALLEDEAPGAALAESRRRTRGAGVVIASALVGWWLAAVALSTVVTGLLAWAGQRWLPGLGHSMTVLAMGVGVALIAWLLAALAVELVETVTFGLLVTRLHARLGAGATRVTTGDDAARTAAARWRRLRWAALAAALVAPVAGLVAVHSVRLEDRTTITAHRGAAGAAPENTMAAFERAIADGADWIELDVQESADGVVVVSHDRDLMRVAGEPLQIHAATLAELQRVDVGRRFGAAFTGERVPTLDQVLARCRGRIRINIELKYYGFQQRLEERVIDLVEQHDMAQDIVIMSLHVPGVRKIRELRPGFRVGQLAAVAVGDLAREPVDFLALRSKLVTRARVRAAHRAGKEIMAWTVDDPGQMWSLASRGVDSLITNEPALAREVLAQRALVDPAGRVLIDLALHLGVVPRELRASRGPVEPATQ